MYGFVYIWFDKKRKKYYIGSHHGSLNDGYIGSSQWMKRAYKKRPHDFKRRVVAFNFINDHKETRLLEERWLQMIDPSQLKKRYYNIKRNAAGGYTTEGYSVEEKKVYLQKLKIAQFGDKHHKARAVIIDGQRYSTLTEAKGALGFDPIKRIVSHNPKHTNYYYEDVGPSTVEEQQAFLDRRKRNVDRMAEVNRSLSKEYHANRVAKSVATRKLRSKEIGQEISKRLMNRPTNPIMIDDQYFPNYSAAARHYNVTGRTIINRIKNSNYPNYRKIYVS